VTAGDGPGARELDAQLVVCLECNAAGVRAVGDRAWAARHRSETRHPNFAAVAPDRLTGAVAFVNPARGLAAVHVGAHGYMVLEILGAFDLEVGDRLSGLVRRHGGCTVYLERARCNVRVFVQAYDATPINAQQLVNG
jgi:hypothetical protein